MLTKLTTSLALLAMATTVVDALMSYCLKHKEVYLKMKYSEIQVVENNDGSISRAEFDAMHAKKFEKMDADNNGSVSQGEWTAMKEKWHEKRKEMKQKWKEKKEAMESEE